MSPHNPPKTQEQCILSQHSQPVKGTIKFSLPSHNKQLVQLSLIQFGNWLSLPPVRARPWNMDLSLPGPKSGSGLWVLNDTYVFTALIWHLLSTFGRCLFLQCMYTEKHYFSLYISTNKSLNCHTCSCTNWKIAKESEREEAILICKKPHTSKTHGFGVPAEILPGQS